jgi:DNA-binding NtrC family response regulator
MDTALQSIRRIATLLKLDDSVLFLNHVLSTSRGDSTDDALKEVIDSSDLPILPYVGDDVILLACHFLRHLQKENERVSGFSQEALALLRQYSWPGNIRELRNVVERGLALTRGNMILPNDLPTSIQRAELLPTVHGERKSTTGTRIDTLEDAEREYLISLLQKNSGNVSQSAEQAGMSRQGLHKLLKKHGVDAKDYRL